MVEQIFPKIVKMNWRYEPMKVATAKIKTLGKTNLAKYIFSNDFCIEIIFLSVRWIKHSEIL